MRWFFSGNGRACLTRLGLLLALATPASAPANELVRVGVYENTPKIGLSPEGRPEGIFIDILEAVAQEENWTLEFVPGTWAEGLARLQAGEIDLMPDVASSPEREERFAFHHEPVLSDWFQIYARQGSGIRSLLDLKEQRVAVLDQSIQQVAFEKLATDLGLHVTLIPLQDYSGAWSAVARHEADAVIANRFWGTAHLRRRSPLEDTAIIFHPTRVFFAAPRTGNPALLDALDRHLAHMKADPDSAYYRSLRRWTSEELGLRLPLWLKITGSLLVLLVLCGWAVSFALKCQVTARTRELQRRNEENTRLLAQVQASEARFRSFVENANDVVFALSPEGVFTYVSPNWQEFLGHEPRDVVGRRYSDFIHPDDLPACQAALDRARQGLKQSNVEYRARHQDGSWRWHVSSGALIHEGDGQPFFLGIARDNTSRKQAEEHLRFHAQLLNSVRESVVASDLDGRILYWGRGAEKMYGYSAAEVLGKPYRDFAGAVAPPDETAFRQEILARGAWHGEHLQKDRQGRTFWTSTSISLVLDEKGKPAGYIGIDRDISERQQAEAALRKSEERFLQVAQTAKEWIWEMDAAGVYTYSSPGVETILGYRPEELVGRMNFIDLIAPEAREEIRQSAAARTARKEGFLKKINPVLRKDGGVVILETTGMPILGPDGRLTGYRGVDTDITERQKAVAEREQLQSQLLHAQKLESVGRLAGGVAHDFNNMLGAVLGYTELLLADIPADHPHHADLLEIRKAAERAANLTRQLLAFASKQTILPRTLDLNAAVGDLLNMLRRLISEKIELDWRPAPDLPAVRLDPTQLDQVLANLCVNASDAIARHGKIILETKRICLEEADCVGRPDRRPGTFAMLSVTDTGCGMTTETLSRIFEPFFTTKVVGEGTGLGLPCVYGIVQQNNGFIEVESRLGRGTAFHIYLPSYSEA